MTNRFLIRRKGTKKLAHHWTGSDTVCRMYSTGGLARGLSHYVICDEPKGHPICTMCATAMPPAPAPVLEQQVA